jgi:hypothetical protein
LWVSCIGSEHINQRFKEPAKEKAYKLVSKFDDGNIVQNLVNQTRNMVLDGVTVGMMTAMNGEYAKALRGTTLKGAETSETSYDGWFRSGST